MTDRVIIGMAEKINRGFGVDTWGKGRRASAEKNFFLFHSRRDASTCRGTRIPIHEHRGQSASGSETCRARRSLGRGPPTTHFCDFVFQRFPSPYAIVAATGRVSDRARSQSSRLRWSPVPDCTNMARTASDR